ncbi:MAG: amidohydrolase [Alphaproteobacteria bacterium]
MRTIPTAILAATGLLMAVASVQAQIPLADAHLHYSHDAWDILPPAEAIKVLRKAGLRRAFVSSSSDRGTQMLYRLAPDLIVPVLRPYRRRGELGTWFKYTSVGDKLAELLARNTYAGIGEFHIFGKDADLAVPRRMVRLAVRYKIFLHAHADAEVLDRIFAQDPEGVAAMLSKHKNLWSDLAFRSEHATDGKVDPHWRKLFLAFPDRFMLGTDTFTPERWCQVIDQSNGSRQWLADLPLDVAENIAYRNAQTLARWALGSRRR